MQGIATGDTGMAEVTGIIIARITDNTDTMGDQVAGIN
jgi:hypothetical protein